MTAQYRHNDVTDTVNLCDSNAVASAVCAIGERRYPDFDERPIRQGFADMEHACAGNFPGLLACDTPYHDLCHFFDAALLMARLIDGYEMRETTDEPLRAEQFSVAILLALFHDVGLLRRENEGHLQGAQLMRDEELRSVEFMRGYLQHGVLASYCEQAALILVTDITRPASESLHGLPENLVPIGQMLGTADLLSQLSGRYYLENCRDALYSELVTAGSDQTVSANGKVQVLFESPHDLLRKTPAFYQNIVKQRLDHDFSEIYRHLTSHFGGDDPYMRGVHRNLAYLDQLISSNDFSGLRRSRHPVVKAG